MEAHRTFERRRWPLHFALAWVLTGDRAFAERAKPSDFHPRLTEDDWISRDEVDRAWRILHQALAGGSVPAFKVSEPCGDGHAGEASEERLAPDALASLDWADLAKTTAILARLLCLLRRWSPISARQRSGGVYVRSHRTAHPTGWPRVHDAFRCGLLDRHERRDHADRGARRFGVERRVR